MDKPLLQENYKGYVIKVYQDEGNDDPREWENMAHFYFWHNRYSIGDKHTYSVEEMQELIKQHKKIWFVFPVTMYDHSGIGFSLTRDRYPFNCPWDSGQVGWIVVTKEDILENFGGRQGKLVGEETMEARALKIAEQELDVYNDFVQGNIYGYVIENDELLDPVIDDSCWGYYGDPEEVGGAMHEAKDIIDYTLEHYKPKG